MRVLKIIPILGIIILFSFYTYTMKCNSEKRGAERAQGQLEYFQAKLERHSSFREYILKQHSLLDSNSTVDDLSDISYSRVALNSGIHNTVAEINSTLSDLNTAKYIFDSKSKVRVYLIRRDLEKIRQRAYEQEIDKF